MADEHDRGRVAQGLVSSAFDALLVTLRSKEMPRTEDGWTISEEGIIKRTYVEGYEIEQTVTRYIRLNGLLRIHVRVKASLNGDCLYAEDKDLDPIEFFTASMFMDSIAKIYIGKRIATEA